MFEEPMLSRLNRLDNILRQLEDFHSCSKSCSSTTSSGALTSEGRPSDFSPQYRPVSEVLMEVQQKGTLIERLVRAEDRILKLCSQLGEELEGEKNREVKAAAAAAAASNSPKMRLKQLVKSCVPAKSKSKHKNNTPPTKLFN